ncbi:glutathione S-transferase family protein [Chitinasiproducens palmae]|uniref:Glutathione S-transferase n=1 Tax=Chitinasiproducens palmae TaxID=1770053 RepID=A0A1H2PIQ1_9BURK|nr:glutathione S-transferase family protein [Chitinasiproducens palmae]SDV46153.1 glutathione S-transferase [Chitinasiproducens palmae]
MQLYYSPGACSLADHIALHEADIKFDRIKVDLKAKRTENGENFLDINPKGYVPALRLDDGQLLTENIAVLSWVARQAPALAPQGDLAPFRLIEMLAFISTELHKQFAPIFKGAGEAEQQAARDKIGQRLSYLDKQLNGDYLFGANATVADSYLFVMLMWAQKAGIEIPSKLKTYFERVKARPAVAKSLEHEGLNG